MCEITISLPQTSFMRALRRKMCGAANMTGYPTCTVQDHSTANRFIT